MSNFDETLSAAPINTMSSLLATSHQLYDEGQNVILIGISNYT